jgi:anoctamin-10
LKIKNQKVMALLNNVIEFPSDAFKIVTHFRHPLPKRTDTIGPWLDCLSFLTWISALTNSALVYLFRPRAAALSSTTATGTAGTGDVPGTGRMEFERAHMREVLERALFIALAASHGYIVLRTIVRHVLERTMWYGSPEKARLDAAGREVKARYLQSVGGAATVGIGIGAGASGATAAEEAATSVGGLTPPLLPLPASEPAMPPPGEFWQFDEGLDEIRKGIKEA